MRCRKSMQYSLSSIVCIFLFFMAAISALLRWLNIALFFSVISAFLGAYSIVKQHGQLFSFRLLFWCFSALYALSSPFNIAFGLNENLTFISGNVNNNVFPFLVAYALSCIGYILACTCFLQREEHWNNEAKDSTLGKEPLNINTLKMGFLFTALLASSFEIINLMRIGGVKMLFLGKGGYQSAVGDLSFSLPSETMYTLWGAFIGLYVSIGQKKKGNIKILTILLSLLFLFPFLMCKIILGMRGALVAALLSGIASYSVYRPIKTIRLKNIIWLCVVYIFLMFLYTNRGIVSLILTNPNEFFVRAFDFSNLIEILNPGEGEFGAAFGNFCVFYEKYGMRFERQFGLTYIKGLIVSIPSFLFPVEKPLSITYVFRNEFFSSWASHSRIASTGFSSILEAYMNGGFFGVFLVYVVIGTVLKKIDELRNTKQKNILIVMITSSLAGLCIDFHRTEFGGIFSSVVWDSIYSVIIYICASFFERKNMYEYNFKN